jgi:hypothetical protein
VVDARTSRYGSLHNIVFLPYNVLTLEKGLAFDRDLLSNIWMDDLHPIIVNENRSCPANTLIVSYSRFYACDSWGNNA